MVVVPAGSFMMGSSEQEQGRSPKEGPQHQVKISQPFAIGKFPVTVGEYRQFASATNHQDTSWEHPGFSQTDRDPVAEVSWDDAKSYVAWLSEKTGKHYRLLSEAEYEYAERAGTTTRFWWGDDEGQLCSHANGDECHRNGTVPGGSYPANAFGLYDMAGNVWEWIEDCYHPNYNAAPTDGTAWTSGACGDPVLRGSGWGFDWQLMRSATRGSYLPGQSCNYLGFRVARTL